MAGLKHHAPITEIRTDCCFLKKKKKKYLEATSIIWVAVAQVVMWSKVTG